MRNTEALKKSLTSGALLAAFAILAAALLAGVWQLTNQRIADNERRYLLSSLNTIVPATQYDNDLFENTIQVSAPDLLGTTEPVTVYRAYQDGQPVAALFSVVAPNGYSGPIRLLVGIYADGQIAGVRVIAHRETPGLGDKIELTVSNWILSFNGKSLGNPPAEKWRVKKDGGVFDQFTGATITPRAVTQAIKRALLYFQKNRDSIFSKPPKNQPTP